MLLLAMALAILMSLMKNVTDDTDVRKAKQALAKLGRWVDRPMKAF